jgi:hypothetical protein
MNIPIIIPTAVYTLKTLTELLSLKPGTLPRELRLGRLRFSKRAGRVFILGIWVLEWFESGEIMKRRQSELNGAARVGESRRHEMGS